MYIVHHVQCTCTCACTEYVHVSLQNLDREHSYQWILQHRLPLFLHSDLYSEYNLCKLLTTPYLSSATSASSSIFPCSNASYQTAVPHHPREKLSPTCSLDNRLFTINRGGIMTPALPSLKESYGIPRQCSLTVLPPQDSSRRGGVEHSKAISASKSDTIFEGHLDSGESLSKAIDGTTICRHFRRHSSELCSSHHNAASVSAVANCENDGDAVVAKSDDKHFRLGFLCMCTMYMYMCRVHVHVHMHFITLTHVHVLYMYIPRYMYNICKHELCLYHYVH